MICQKNLFYIKKSKKINNRRVKIKNYFININVFFNNKFNEVKINYMPENKFIDSFCVVDLVGKQTCKLKLFKK